MFAIRKQNHESKEEERWWLSLKMRGGSYGGKAASFPCNIYLDEIIHVLKLSNVLFLRCHLFNSWKLHLHRDSDLFCNWKSKSDCSVVVFGFCLLSSLLVSIINLYILNLFWGCMSLLYITPCVMEFPRWLTHSYGEINNKWSSLFVMSCCKSPRVPSFL